MAKISRVCPRIPAQAAKVCRRASRFYQDAGKLSRAGKCADATKKLEAGDKALECCVGDGRRLILTRRDVLLARMSGQACAHKIVVRDTPEDDLEARISGDVGALVGAGALSGRRRNRELGAPPSGDKPLILTDLIGTEVSWKPKGFLGGDMFAKYREALSGARYDPKRQCQMSPVDLYGKFKANLEAVGFEVSGTPALKAKIREAADRASASEQSAEEQIQTTAGTLYGFQKEGVRWMAPRPRLILADEQGLGKSVEAAVALPKNARAVLVAPKTLRLNWRKELKKWRPDLRVRLLQAGDKFVWPEPGEVVITSYNLLPGEFIGKNKEKKLNLTVGPPPPGVMIVADECQAIKNEKSLRGSTFGEMARLTRESGGATWLLTGTPLLNRPPELWALLDAAGLAHETFGSYKAFANLFGGYKTRYGWIWGKKAREAREMAEGRGGHDTNYLDDETSWDDATSEDGGDSLADTGLIGDEALSNISQENSRIIVEKLQKVMLRRQKADVLTDLPAKQLQFLEVETDFSKADEEVLRELKEAWDAKAASEGAASWKDVLPPFEELSRAKEVLARAKTPAAMEIIDEYEEAGTPLVVFSAYRAPVNLIGKRPGWALITGDTKAERRQEIVEDFQAGKLKGVAGTIAAAGTGLTLTHASNMLFIDRDWVPANNWQAEDRIHRISQKEAVLIKVLQADHAVDARIQELLEEKRAIVVQTVEAARSVTGNAPTSEMSRLLHEAADNLADSPEVVPDAPREWSNKFPGPCAKCGVRIAAQAGIAYKEGSAWKVKHKPGECKDIPVTLQPDGSAKPVKSVRRPPKDRVERWAAEGLRRLTENDPDSAMEINDIGFNKLDGKFGKSLNSQCQSEGLTDAQWNAAITLLSKYWRQIGRKPGSD